MEVNVSLVNKVMVVTKSCVCVGGGGGGGGGIFTHPKFILN